LVAAPPRLAGGKMDQHQTFLPMGALAFLTFFVEIVHLAAAHESGNDPTATFCRLWFYEQ
jgi:hypothetical protein